MQKAVPTQKDETASRYHLFSGAALLLSNAGNGADRPGLGKPENHANSFHFFLMI
jgi:hypothetical protein